ncbi:G patch domain-containing protein 4 [Microcaecilia unicolor]|uniref:G patch domain-containing protein 4 n=1 Tax=Microcaecilia unicolor TaxID=1415580 RepID=A0A6P7X439_9AMPH|nr:G patch domain-containing protein 4-like [Microcaecilia unicolor]XP_030044885.1 G patch domain-containing protein 4-like [Microcaecilia unicolor]
MSAPPESKSSGMEFAERQLKRHGWKKGQGLGRQESGISEAIKVKVKCGKAGVGHNSAEQFTFHWWDHVFNKTASNITVETDEDGTRMKRLTEGSGQISNKKPRKGLNGHNMLYGRFVKAATLMSGGEIPEVEPKSSESSKEDEEKLDFSSANKLTDEELMRACGGRTAHKGARHGFCMSAKLARLEEQERAFLATYEEKKQKVAVAYTEAEAKSSKKKKRKKSKRQAHHAAESSEERERPRKEKQRSKMAAKKRKQFEGLAEGQSESELWPVEQEEASEGAEVEEKKQRRERKTEKEREISRPSCKRKKQPK